MSTIRFGKHVLSTHCVLAAVPGGESSWYLCAGVQNGWTGPSSERDNKQRHIDFTQCLLIDFNAARWSPRVATQGLVNGGRRLPRQQAVHSQ